MATIRHGSGFAAQSAEQASGVTTTHWPNPNGCWDVSQDAGKKRRSVAPVSTENHSVPDAIALAVINE